MKILVTGASGHLGGNLVRRLLKNNQLVKVLLRPESNNEAVQNLDVEKYYGDLRNENESCCRTVNTCDFRIGRKKPLYC